MGIKKIESFEGDLVLLFDDIVKKLGIKEGDELSVSVVEKNKKKSILIEKK